MSLKTKDLQEKPLLLRRYSNLHHNTINQLEDKLRLIVMMSNILILYRNIQP